MRVAWLFNLDAEAELAALRSGSAPRPPGAPARRRQAAARAQLARGVDEGGWVGPGDLVLDPGAPHPCVTGSLPDKDLSGITPRAWSPTPSAKAAMARVGLALEGPPLEALIGANARETFAALDPLPGSSVADSVVDLRAAVEEAPLPRSGLGASSQPAWLLRRSLSCAGGGRLVAEGWHAGVASWAASALEQGPIEVQPLVDVVEEYSIHGWVHRGGVLRCGSPLCWRSADDSSPGGEVAPLLDRERARIEGSALEVGARLRELGYFGPFGVDAFRWRRADGVVRLQVGTDINARWTLHFARGAPELMRSVSGQQEHLAEG